MERANNRANVSITPLVSRCAKHLGSTNVAKSVTPSHVLKKSVISAFQGFCLLWCFDKRCTYSFRFFYSFYSHTIDHFDDVRCLRWMTRFMFRCHSCGGCGRLRGLLLIGLGVHLFNWSFVMFIMCYTNCVWIFFKWRDFFICTARNTILKKIARQ